jgi:hypothetical protein
MDPLRTLVRGRTVHLLKEAGIDVAMDKGGVILQNDSGSIQLNEAQIKLVGRLLHNTIDPLLDRESRSRSR